MALFSLPLAVLPVRKNATLNVKAKQNAQRNAVIQGRPRDANQKKNAAVKKMNAARVKLKERKLKPNLPSSIRLSNRRALQYCTGLFLFLTNYDE